MEAIVLAGGLGTRLKSSIGNYPKCMAPVNGKPFLNYLFHYLQSENIERVILSLGYEHQIVLDWLRTQQLSFALDNVIEYEPLGTGGGIHLAMQKVKDDNVVVLNGDTLFQVPLQEQLSFHEKCGATTTLALKEMHQFDRYGAVNIDANNCITSFSEKKYNDVGLINGGIYILSKKAFFEKNLPEKFSFEKEYLERFLKERKFYGFNCSNYFIDIGIPADYAQAQEDFKTLLK